VSEGPAPELKKQMSQLLEACPLCHNSDLPDLYHASDPHYGIPGRYRIVKCANCSLIFLNPMYCDEELASLYPADYYAYQDQLHVSRAKQIAKRALGYWQGTKEPKLPRPGRFLDVGCGSGSFLQKMLREGWECHGVEISRKAVALGRSRGLNICIGNLSAHFHSEYFDYIRASHSLEHMTSPRETLLEIYRILKPGGTLMLAVPNIDSVNAKVFKQYWWHLCAPVHAFDFSVKTLSRLLSECGFELRKVRFNSDYVGLLGSLQIWLNRDKQRNSSHGFVFNSRVLRVWSSWVQKLLDLAGSGDMIEVTATKPVRRTCCDSVAFGHKAEQLSWLQVK